MDELIQVVKADPCAVEFSDDVESESEKNALMSVTSEAFNIIHNPGKLVEVRAIYRDGILDEYGRPMKPWTGTFDDPELLMQSIGDAIAEVEIARIQWSLNTPRPDWKVDNVLLQGKPCLRATDIVRRDWVFLDFDRPAGLEPMIGWDVFPILANLGWLGVGNPLLVSSGRGINALFRAGWNFANETVDFHVLCRALAHKFNDEDLTIDDATSLERGCKVAGTMARKTDDESTWRPIVTLNPDASLTNTPQSAWQVVLDDLRKDGHVLPPKREFSSDGKGAPMAEGFDLCEFCEAYDIEILGDHGDRFDIDCPLKGERHSGGASVTSLFYDGDRLGFKCLHPDHDDVTIGKLVSVLQAEQGTYQLPLFAERDNIAVEDVDEGLEDEKESQ
jgi:hypothetical protein